MEKGSFKYYLSLKGRMVSVLARALKIADEEYMETIRLVYPGLIEAYEMDDWNKSPRNENKLRSTK